MFGLYKNHRIVSIWVGNFKSEIELNKYMQFEYDNNGDAYSKFVEHSQLEWFDEDYMEIHFLQHPMIKNIEYIKNHFLDADLFFDDFLKSLETIDTTSFNSLIFLYGKKGINEALFEHLDSTSLETHPIQLVFKKVY